jgi:hypothetical protein
MTQLKLRRAIQATHFQFVEGDVMQIRGEEKLGADRE